MERMRGIKRIRRHCGQSAMTLAGIARVMEKEGLFLTLLINSVQHRFSLNRRQVDELRIKEPRTPRPKYPQPTNHIVELTTGRSLFFCSRRCQETCKLQPPSLRSRAARNGIAEVVEPNRSHEFMLKRRGGRSDVECSMRSVITAGCNPLPNFPGEIESFVSSHDWLCYDLSILLRTYMLVNADRNGSR
jgi:hypothetical protein